MDEKMVPTKGGIVDDTERHGSIREKSMDSMLADISALELAPNPRGS